MSDSRPLPARREIWERLSDFPYWITGSAAAIAVVLNDTLGLWGSLLLALILTTVAMLCLSPLARRSRQQRLAGNIEHGVLEASLRFTDDAGHTPNNGWREGALWWTATGFVFQQLQGPGGKPVQELVEVAHPQPLGQRPYNPKQAVGLQPGWNAFGFLTGTRDLEIVIDPAYLNDSDIRQKLTGEKQPE